MTQCPALALVALLGTASIASGCYLSHSIGAASDAGAADARAADARAPDAPGVDAARVDAGLSDAPAVDGYVASMCERVSPDEWILPVAVRGGDFTTQVPIGMRFRAGGCSCTPRPYEEEAVVGAELCDCCFDCDCIAPSYEATVVRNEPAGLGSYTPIAPNGARGPTIVIVDWGVSCAPISEAADVVEIVIPDGTATPARPVGVWAHVRGIHFRCSADVLPVPAERGAVLPPVFVMEDCSPDIDPCGPITPTPYETNVFLGYYETGTHRVIAFGAEVVFAVP